MSKANDLAGLLYQIFSQLRLATEYNHDNEKGWLCHLF
ncbi:hypothetical protein SALWKB29_1348 [Snodgrassella communis]|uniref:Uncharacterized protein n=1 Tax=Snodgrassella communis TaxID=2946699 RepID=A0A836Z483_9NEIS|nr:hypothetical protein SALWKB29_1348 [Snodgrassella communis]